MSAIKTGWFGCQHCRKTRCRHTPPMDRVCPILKPIYRTMKAPDILDNRSWINLSTKRLELLKQKA